MITAEFRDEAANPQAAASGVVDGVVVAEAGVAADGVVLNPTGLELTVSQPAWTAGDAVEFGTDEDPRGMRGIIGYVQPEEGVAFVKVFCKPVPKRRGDTYLGARRRGPRGPRGPRPRMRRGPNTGPRGATQQAQEARARACTRPNMLPWRASSGRRWR